jgi:hypothetical protein
VLAEIRSGFARIELKACTDELAASNHNPAVQRSCDYFRYAKDLLDVASNFLGGPADSAIYLFDTGSQTGFVQQVTP